MGSSVVSGSGSSADGLAFSSVEDGENGARASDDVREGSEKSVFFDCGLGLPPLAILSSCDLILVGLSNLMPISSEVHMQ